MPCSPPFPLPLPSLPHLLSLSSFLPVPLICFFSSLFASLSLSHFLCLPSTPPFSLSLISRFYGAIPRNLGIPGSWRQHRPHVPCCPSARWLKQKGWAKGRGRRPQQPNLQLQPGSDWERNKETRNLGTEGVGCQIGQRLPSSCKSEPLPAL